MRTTPLPVFRRFTPAEWFAETDSAIYLETVDCEVCGERMVPHLITSDEVEFGLCDKHLHQAQEIADGQLP